MSPDKFTGKVAKFGCDSLNGFEVIQLFSKGGLKSPPNAPSPPPPGLNRFKTVLYKILDCF